MTWMYIAGFFDGEGSLVHNGKGFRISIAQANEVVLLEIKEFIGFGNIIKVKKRQAHWKDSWVYCIAKQENVLKFINNVKDHLIVKKNIVTSAIPRLKVTLSRIAKRENLKVKRTFIVKQLRDNGLTYRAIGRKVGIDFGYARRLVIK